MITKVVIAAAGRGTRMLHLTDDKPKHLIKVNGKPFLFYILDSLLKAGYKEIILVAGYKKELVEEFLKDYLVNESSDLEIKFLNQYEKLNPEEKYGTACPLMLKEVVNFIGNEQFLYISGDNLFSAEDLRTINIDDEFCYIAGIEQDHPEKYGVLVSDGDNYLEKIVEKPSPSKILSERNLDGQEKFSGNLINAGLYKFTPEIFDKISEIKKSPRGEYEITDAVSLLAKEKKVKIKKIKDSWHDFGNPEDIKKLSKFLEDGNHKN